jgi:hypothetical protein
MQTIIRLIDNWGLMCGEGKAQTHQPDRFVIREDAVYEFTGPHQEGDKVVWTYKVASTIRKKRRRIGFI